MPKTDPRIDTYIARSRDFAKPILKHLRMLVHEACPDVQETMKWSSPFFMHKGILCNMAAFKEHCSFGFWNRDIVPGSAESEESAHGQFGRITKLSDLPGDNLLLGYIRQAAQLNDSGVPRPATRPSKPKKELRVPKDLKAALQNNKKAMATFSGFSPSHRREYVEWITDAKREETRQKRLETALQWMSTGKSRHWKYV